MKTKEITVACRALEATPAGPIVSVSFVGHYPPGSLGNEPWARAINQAKGLIADQSPAALVFDLAELDYVWGDSIAGGLLSLVYDAKRQRPRAACVVARGRTARVLDPLYAIWLGRHDMPMFEAEEEGVAFLRQKLAQRAV